ncbi:hypothetical protein O1L55_22775 [Streptomyces albulus]|nr:hypothetical protein [Streptomyces noursei]
MTVRPRVAPLVVRALPAQRRLVLECSSAMTTQPSARDSSRARSTISFGRLLRVPRGLIDPPPASC